jgi:glycosyltransferase involved in cell wall biosynthesis
MQWGEEAPDLVLVGDGPSRPQLERDVSKAGLTNIRFIGPVALDEARRWIATSRMVLLPSRWFEGFPMVLQEAFVFGTPAVVSDIGALPDIVLSNDCGAVFRVGDTADLFNVTRALWSDTQRLEAMAVRAREEYRDKYDEAANYEQLISIYDEATEGRHGP